MIAASHGRTDHSNCLLQEVTGLRNEHVNKFLPPKRQKASQSSMSNQNGSGQPASRISIQFLHVPVQDLSIPTLEQCAPPLTRASPWEVVDVLPAVTSPYGQPLSRLTFIWTDLRPIIARACACEHAVQADCDGAGCACMHLLFELIVSICLPACPSVRLFMMSSDCWLACTCTAHGRDKWPAISLEHGRHNIARTKGLECLPHWQSISYANWHTSCYLYRSCVPL